MTNDDKNAFSNWKKQLFRVSAQEPKIVLDWFASIKDENLKIRLERTEPSYKDLVKSLDKLGKASKILTPRQLQLLTSHQQEIFAQQIEKNWEGKSQFEVLDLYLSLTLQKPTKEEYEWALGTLLIQKRLPPSPVRGSHVSDSSFREQKSFWIHSFGRNAAMIRSQIKRGWRPS